MTLRTNEKGENMETLKIIMLIIMGFSSGIVISGAVFAFIAIIGVVPRFAQKSNTVGKIMIYEEAIILGGIFGSLEYLFEFKIPMPNIMIIIYSFCIGMFYGVLAVSLAEVLDVIPILRRRTNIQKGLTLFVIVLAVGKLSGSILDIIVVD